MKTKITTVHYLALVFLFFAACSAPEQKEIIQEKGNTDLVDTATSNVIQEATTPEPTKEDFNGTYLNSRKESLVISNYKENVGFDYSYKSGKNASSCSRNNC